ncbi:MAG: maleylpyruvate isomerase family mycothiol-dependent enzyme [Acidimicrobiia bacterium]
MDTDRYLAAIEMDAAIMLAAATAVPLDTPVPSCPGWTMRDLIVHTGVVHRHKTAIVRHGLIDGAAPQPPEPTSDEIQWFGDGVDEMLAVFRAADLGLPTWTWCTHDHAAEWWVRRMAHETAIHGADALITTGQSPQLDEWLGLDGVDELLDEMMVGAPDWAEVAELDNVVGLRSGDREWLLRPATFSGTSTVTGKAYEDFSTVMYAEGEPDAVVSTDGSTMDLWLWGRGDLAADQVDGDESLVLLIREIAAESTQ